MKFLFIILIGTLLIPFTGLTQDCDTIFVDLKKGTINNLKLTASQNQVIKKLPCSTGTTPDGSDYNCGGGVFFLNNDCFFYTGENYFEARQDFNGKLSIPILGLEKEEAIHLLKLGKPIRKKNVAPMDYLFFKTTYGCLFIKISEGKVVQVDISAKQAKDVHVCL